ncbi:hypothetical protein OOT46_26965 [Aquabacterium sp. A7-Y]|uniref:hypothetical protein n=1 Tax=Aquabacterium sp. A7-Y TaxID=1349605 RepID=UPI00223D6372|nr:hypothetical protein [Aquabacterium sp. A7-Y]MCW7541455.1 hypothetical protein [Aquabacterium sp. A7-Y]
MDEYYPCISSVTWHRWLKASVATLAQKQGEQLPEARAGSHENQERQGDHVR